MRYTPNRVCWFHFTDTDMERPVKSNSDVFEIREGGASSGLVDVCDDRSL